MPCVKDADTLDFRVVRARLRGPRPQGPHQPDQPRRLRRHHGDADQPRDPRDGPVGAPAHARPGGDRRGRRARATRPGSRPPTPRCSPSSASARSSPLTSTYDHRIIQGAESGLFLAQVAELLDRRATTSTTRSSSRWASPTSRSGGGPTRTRASAAGDATIERLVKQVHVQTLINMYRVRGHLIAHLDPLEVEPPRCTPSSTR